jgi:hypothetical protein
MSAPINGKIFNILQLTEENESLRYIQYIRWRESAAINNKKFRVEHYLHFLANASAILIGLKVIT